ncbi:MAG: Si-specific NAD(P)(+) transhydrogenase [Gemmataceae bacterium]|nr:Si-specific NAD(P)(+) transhydrogenase [Gemmataceae bacterium]
MAANEDCQKLGWKGIGVTEHFDLVVIGSGPAGEKGAAAAAFFGKKVALVEKDNFLGGAAANTGTLPSKTLRESALYLSGFHQRKLFGFNVDFKKKVRISDFMAHEHFVKDQERQRIRENLNRHHIQVFRGLANFIDDKTLCVRPDRCPEVYLTADRFLIATGSYPFRPKNFPFYDPRIFDSDTILSLDEIPSDLVVVGGGVIGCEYACMFAALGVKVQVIEKHDMIVSGMDREISHTLQTRMGAAGVEFYMNDSVQRLEPGNLMELELESGPVLQPKAVLVSSGRSGQTAALGLDKIGVETTPRGHIVANEHFQTKAPNIYAAGDVIGNPALASTAMEQARLAVYHAFSLAPNRDLPTLLPSGLYTIPECSMAGMTEEQLEEKKIPFVAGKASFASNARGQIIGDTDGMVKLLYHEETNKLLGVHIIGEGATELVHIGLTAMMLGADNDLFINTCFNYPTLSEVYKYATFDAKSKLATRKKRKMENP